MVSIHWFDFVIVMTALAGLACTGIGWVNLRSDDYDGLAGGVGLLFDAMIAAGGLLITAVVVLAMIVFRLSFF